MLTLRTIDKEADGRISHADYAHLCAWWKARAPRAPEREVLPTLGIIAEFNGRPIAVAFAYLDATGSGVAWLGWMATDPQAPKIRAGLALHRALEFLQEECGRLNYWLMWATLGDSSFIRFMENRGYTAAERHLCHLFKCIDPAEPGILTPAPVST